MQLKIIKNEKEYDEALNRIDELMELNPELETPQSDELEILVLSIITWNIFQTFLSQELRDNAKINFESISDFKSKLKSV